MKVHPIIMRAEQLMEQVDVGDRRFYLPLRIEIRITDFTQRVHRDEIHSMLAHCNRHLSRLDYDLSSHHDEAGRQDVFTATQRDPISHLLRATREQIRTHHSLRPDFYTDMGLANEEVPCAYHLIYLHVRDEQHLGRRIGLARDRFPSSWRQPRYEWCRADARHARSRTVQQRAQESLGQPFDTDVIEFEHRRRAAEDRLRREADTAALEASFSNVRSAIRRLPENISFPSPTVSLRDFLEMQNHEVAALMGIPASMLQALQETRGNGGAATPATLPAAPPAPKPPALLLQPRGRFLTLPTP